MTKPKCPICNKSDVVELSHYPESGTHYCSRDGKWFTPKDQPSLGNNPKDRLGSQKVSFSKLPAVGILHGDMAMMYGASQYDPYNWRDNAVIASIYVDAIARHLMAWFDAREEDADDSGVTHLGHIIANAAIILDAQATGNLIDDRPPKGQASAVLKQLNEKLKVLIPRWREIKEKRLKEKGNG